MSKRTKGKLFIAAKYGKKRWGIGRAGGEAEWFYHCKVGDTDDPANREDAAHFLAARNACDRLGLTADQLNAGVLDEMVAALRLWRDGDNHEQYRASSTLEAKAMRNAILAKLDAEGGE